MTNVVAIADAALRPKYVTMKRACEYSGMGITKLYALIRDGKIVARKLDKRTLIEFETLERYLSTLPIVELKQED